MEISKIAYITIKHYAGEVNEETIDEMVEAGFVEIINGAVEVAA